MSVDGRRRRTLALLTTVWSPADSGRSRTVLHPSSSESGRLTNSHTAPTNVAPDSISRQADLFPGLRSRPPLRSEASIGSRTKR